MRKTQTQTKEKAEVMMIIWELVATDPTRSKRRMTAGLM